MPQSLDALIDRLDWLLEDLSNAEAEHADIIAAVAETHRAGAVNLVHYTRLRKHDLRALQNDLMDIGVTSLSTSEADVRTKIHAARNVLAALRGDQGPWNLNAITQALEEGDDILAANSDALFGPMRPGRPTRIMVTLPSEAAQDGALVAAFVDSGMDVARVNCAHDGPDAWARMVVGVRSAAAAAGRQVLVSMDLPGPKLRTGPIIDGPAVARARVTRDETGRLLASARLWLTSADAPAAAPPRAPTAWATRPLLDVRVDGPWLAARRRGDKITMTDEWDRNRTFVVLEVTQGGALAEGPRSARVANGMKLVCDESATVVDGISPVRRRLRLARGDHLVLTRDLTPVQVPAFGQVARIGCTLPEAISAMKPGDAVLIDDAKISAFVESVSPGEVTLRIARTKPGGQALAAEKGINLPGTVLPLHALTPADEAQLPFITAHADLVAVSFIRTPDDITHILDRLRAAGAGDLALVLKIETRQGFENLPSILLTAMQYPKLGVMIARGDLAAEVGFERLSEVPRQILALCEAAHVPAIWATQVLETLAKTGLPSRAEITDAAAAQRAECVMLNKGPRILDAIRALDDILARMGEVQRKGRNLMRRVHSWDGQ